MSNFRIYFSSTKPSGLRNMRHGIDEIPDVCVSFPEPHGGVRVNPGVHKQATQTPNGYQRLFSPASKKSAHLIRPHKIDVEILLTDQLLTSEIRRPADFAT